MFNDEITEDELEQISKELTSLIAEDVVVKIEESSEPYIDETDDENPLNGSAMYFGYIEDLAGNTIEDSMTGYYCDPSSVRDDLISYATKASLITKRYSLVMDSQEAGLDVLEDYDTKDQALRALEEIREKGFHIPENYSSIEEDKVTFEKYETITVSLYIDIFNQNINQHFTEAMEHTPIYFFQGRVVSPAIKDYEALSYLRESTKTKRPLLEKHIAEINEWNDNRKGMLVGKNTLVCTVDEEGRIFHIIANSDLKIAEEVDGYLTSVHHYSPSGATKVAKEIKLNGAGADGLKVVPVNMAVFQAEMLSRAEERLKSNISLEKFFKIQDIASSKTEGKGLIGAIESLNSFQKKSQELK